MTFVSTSYSFNWNVSGSVPSSEICTRAWSDLTFRVQFYQRRPLRLLSGTLTLSSLQGNTLTEKLNHWEKSFSGLLAHIEVGGPAALQCGDWKSMRVYPSGKRMRKVSVLMHLFCFSTANATSVTKSVSTVNYGLRSGAKTGERYAFFMTFC